MADNKLTEEQVLELTTILRSDQSLDNKVQYVTNVKSAIKQHNVPENCIPQLFEGLRTAATSQHAALLNAGFTALNHLLTRLSRQEPKQLAKEANRTLPLLMDKLGDQKDKFRTLAVQAINTVYAVAPADVERNIRNLALGGKNPRAKEMGMQWLVQAHVEQGLPFRTYVPLLMDLLEDADGMVRDAAKVTVIELFKTAPNNAKSDLKKQLKNFKVRPAIEQAIVKALAPTGGRSETPADSAPAGRTAPGLSASSSFTPTDRPVTPAAVDGPAETIEPQYVNTHRELDEIFKDMAWHFEGKESEQNWIKREQSMVTLRKLNAGNCPSDFADSFIQGLKSILDGVIKAITSLRTSLSKEGCGLVQDVANTFGPGMDPLVELLMQTLVKLSAGTKKISSQQADKTLDTIISRVTYTPRIMYHLTAAAGDKNIQPRTFATGWFKTIIKKEAQHKSHIEHSGGVEAMEKAIKKGLGDPNPTVREKMRSTYWAFHGVWPAKANTIMEELDATAQKLLNKDPNNPNSPKKGDAPAATRGLSRSTNTASKPSLREHMLAQKRLAAAKNNLPARPGSAMAHISPVRHTASSSSQTTVPVKLSGPRGRQEGTISVNAGSMSVAPMRPVRRRPEVAVAPRPATAGPYSIRDAPGVEIPSPESLKAKTPRGKQPAVTPRKTAPRPRPGHASHASESSIASPNSRPLSRPGASPRISPTTLRQSRLNPATNSPGKEKNDATLAVPTVSDLSTAISQPDTEVESISTPVDETPATTQDSLPEVPFKVPEITLDSQTDGVAQSQPLKVFEDPFTEEEPTPKPVTSTPVLEDKPVNENAASLQKPADVQPQAMVVPPASDSPEKARQNARLLESGITRITAKSLEVHGFRKLQSLLRNNKTVFADEKFEALLIGLFQYLEDPLANIASEKVLDVKAQILATIKLLLVKERENFQPYVSKGLESLLETRGEYDSRAHIVSGLELLADELVTIGDGSEMIVVLTKRLQDKTEATVEGHRTLGMGLHVLKTMLDKRSEFQPTETELTQLAGLAGRCLESSDSGVRMDAVQLCVALHSRVGDAVFWEAMRSMKDDPKSLITYYIVKRQREQGLAV